MNRGMWLVRKNYLATLVKKVSDGHGGDTKEFIEQHLSEILGMCPGERIEEAIRCYEEMVDQLQYYKE